MRQQNYIPGCVVVLIYAGFFGSTVPRAAAQTSWDAVFGTLTIDLQQPGKPISTNLIGVFFEDINYAADGGLYAELVQNRSFEYRPTARPDWTALTAWETVRRGGAEGSVVVADAFPIHPNNPHYIVLEIRQPGAGFGLLNRGFDGIAIQAGRIYDFAVYGRQLYTGNRWGNSGVLEGPARVTAQLENERGEILASAELALQGKEWHRATATLVPSLSEPQARLVVLCHTRGGVALDEISLFPRDTFRGRTNGLRADLAQAIAELKPRFVRFPGGCLVHGYGLDNMYRWPHTVGPVEQRRSQPNLWGYYQSMGLGYFEYFQFCEDIGAQPVPVVPAGVCCQNADHQGGTGQRGLPMEQLPAYVQEVLDLIEWANGPPDSKWGFLRAAAGHPRPFGLKFLAIGNEEHITPVFRERFRMIFEAVRSKYPEILLIGTAGPFHSGPDYEAGWEFAEELKIPVVDEHYYVPPRWFWENLLRYDRYSRERPRVYLGEYAAHDEGRRNTLRSALAEAAYLTSLERNGDVVLMASYAPLLGKRGRTQWNPNLIYFSNTEVLRTVNYYVQQLFSLHSGDTYLAATLEERQSATLDSGPTDDRVFLGTWDTQAEFDDVYLVVGGATAARDDFSRRSTFWQPLTGTWQIRDGVYQQRGRNTPAMSVLNIPTGAAYTLSLRARKTGGSEGFLIGFRYRNPQNYFWWNLGGWNNTRHAIERSLDGQKEIRGPERPGRIESGRWYNVRVEVAHSRIRCYLDDQLLHDIEDAGFAPTPDFAHSAVRDTASGDVILKWVNGSAATRRLEVRLPGLKGPTAATRIVLAHEDPMVTNDFEHPDRVQPQTNSITVSASFACTLPPYSLTVLRIPTR